MERSAFIHISLVDRDSQSEEQSNCQRLVALTGRMQGTYFELILDVRVRTQVDQVQAHAEVPVEACIVYGREAVVRISQRVDPVLEQTLASLLHLLRRLQVDQRSSAVVDYVLANDLKSVQ